MQFPEKQEILNLFSLNINIYGSKLILKWPKHLDFKSVIFLVLDDLREEDLQYYSLNEYFIDFLYSCLTKGFILVYNLQFYKAF